MFRATLRYDDTLFTFKLNIRHFRHDLFDQCFVVDARDHQRTRTCVYN